MGGDGGVGHVQISLRVYWGLGGILAGVWRYHGVALDSIQFQ